ncbi:MAG: hypothetical protein HYV63_28170 [Candidatus Schekmanbacteria bacterium]|nr:hypothetical protein [Candidatus Schekmanbacteria bacterium]
MPDSGSYGPEEGGRCRLLAFRTADTHLHLLAACGRETAGELARRVEIALRRTLALGVPFSPARIKPILDQHHLSSAFLYVLRQGERHGLESDRWCEASNLPDLLGMRVLGTYTAADTRKLLPRLERADLVEILAADLEAPIVSLAPLGEAAAAAACLPTLDGRSLEAIEARRAALEVAGGQIASEELARLLNISAPTLRRMRGRVARPELTRAVTLQLRVRQESVPAGCDVPAPEAAAPRSTGGPDGGGRRQTDHQRQRGITP